MFFTALKLSGGGRGGWKVYKAQDFDTRGTGSQPEYCVLLGLGN